MDARQDYWTALDAADRPRAQQAVSALLDAGWDEDRVVDELVVPSQERIGDLWLRAEWTISQEHMATGVNEAIVYWMISQLPPPEPDSAAVLVSCLQGERHALPALLVARGLATRGLRVVYVGADPEPSSLLVDLVRLRPRAVLFSASLTSALSAQKAFFHSIAVLGIPVIVGGRAFGGPQLGARRADLLGATAYVETVEEVLDLLATLPTRTPAPESDPLGPGDEDAVWLEHYRSEIAPNVVRALAGRHRGTSPIAERWPEVVGHVEHVLGCLGAAIVTKDREIMVEVRDWLAAVLRHRDLDPGLVGEIWDLLADSLRGHHVARVFLASSHPGARGH